MIKVGDLLFCLTTMEIPGWTKLGENVYYKFADGNEAFKKRPVFSFNTREPPQKLRDQLRAAGMPMDIDGHWFSQDAILNTSADIPAKSSSPDFPQCPEDSAASSPQPSEAPSPSRPLKS